MNVIVSNSQQNALANLDIDVIKSISGEYDVNEIVEMFKSFFYSKMILDVTALKEYNTINTYEVLTSGLDPDKIIFLLPEGSNLCTPNFLSQLINLGVYNFTTNIKGIKYLLKKPNTLQDVEKITKMANANHDKDSGVNSITKVTSKVNKGTTIIGFRNVTEHAGATTLIYMLKKELSLSLGSNQVVAIEIDKNDFSLFGDKDMISIRSSEIQSAIERFKDASVILIDLNQCQDDHFCSDIIYLLEPSTIRLNMLVRRNKAIFDKIRNSKVVLNQSLLLNNDVFDFEGEAGFKVFYNMPPLDERKRNAIIADFLSKLGLIQVSSPSGNSNRIFGLFRR